MAVTVVSGDIFQSPVEWLVCPTNTVGAMGKGLALECKKRFPGLFEEYKKLCEMRLFPVGDVVFFPKQDGWPYSVVLLSTKQHYAAPSRVEYVRNGLMYLAMEYVHHDVQSIAIPALGCGEGGLDWVTVQPYMLHYASLMNVPVEVYEPR